MCLQRKPTAVFPAAWFADERRSWARCAIPVALLATEALSGREVAEGIALPIYEEVRTRIRPRVAIRPGV
jgi:hypothetical protein